MEELQARPDLPALVRAGDLAALISDVPFEVNLWRVQNLFYDLLQVTYGPMQERKDPEADEWTRRFAELGEKLSVRVIPG
jgi:hypothetical protein